MKHYSVKPDQCHAAVQHFRKNVAKAEILGITRITGNGSLHRTGLKKEVGCKNYD